MTILFAVCPKQAIENLVGGLVQYFGLYVTTIMTFNRAHSDIHGHY